GPTASGTLALGHNGNLTNTRELTRLVQQRYGTQLSLEGEDCATDTTILTALLAGDSGHTLTETALEMLPQVRGAFSLAFMTEDTLYAARDPQRTGNAPAAARRLPPGGHDRRHPLRRPRPAGDPATGAGPAGTRLGGHLRNRGFGHHRRCLRT